MINSHRRLRCGFVSTRLAGTDGVSLETRKWEHILERMGHECFFFAGECDRPSERSMVVEEAHFFHPDITFLNQDLFDDYIRSSETSGEIQRLRFYLKKRLYTFIKQFGIQVLIVENALSLPMNIPLAMALTELIAETTIATIAHHHDFTWERSRYSVSAAQDYLQAAFPPQLPSVQHVVINSFAAHQLALRTGISATLVPNVMEFENPPIEDPVAGKNLRHDLGINEDAYILLQPTRIVPRKRIELAVELARRLDCGQCYLLITHKSGDEGSDYENYLQDYANLLNVNVIFGSEIINHATGTLPDGRRIYSLADAYQIADLVTYPSTIEGFGNAFLETIYYKRPIVISNYEIFRTDIRPKGFRVIGFDNFISEQTVRLSRELLQNPAICAEMAEHNYRIGRRFYSYRTLENHLVVLLNQCTGIS